MKRLEMNNMDIAQKAVENLKVLKTNKISN